MSHYVIGDVQGCYHTLKALLGEIGFDRRRDALWFVGDLVNRGRHSRDVLALVADLGDAARTVLGNHDVHLLRVLAGVAPFKKLDTIQEVVASPEAGRWCAWLRQRPLVLADERLFVAHAGVLPGWDEATALGKARAIEQRLQDDATWRQTLDKATAPPDLRVFTVMRTVDEQLRLGDYSGTLDAIPPGYQAWFRHPAFRPWPKTIAFGHWSALGVHREAGTLALDSGAVWGRSLTAWRRDDGTFHSVHADPRDLEPKVVHADDQS